MTIFMAYNAVYDACHSLSDGIWQLNTGGASLDGGGSCICDVGYGYDGGLDACVECALGKYML